MIADCHDAAVAALMTEAGAHGPQTRQAMLAAHREAVLATSTLLTGASVLPRAGELVSLDYV